MLLETDLLLAEIEGAVLDGFPLFTSSLTTPSPSITLSLPPSLPPSLSGEGALIIPMYLVRVSAVIRGVGREVGGVQLNPFQIDDAHMQLMQWICSGD